MPAVLIVTGNGALNAVEEDAVALIEAAGHTTQVRDDGVTPNVSSDASNYAAVFITGSAESATGTRYVNHTIPVVTSAHYHTPPLGLGTSSGSGSLTDIDVINISHPITSGVSSGTNALLTSAADITYAIAPVSGTMLATRVGASSRATILVAEQGTSKIGGGTHAGMRIHFGWDTEPAGGTLTATGESLFTAVFDYAIPTMDPPPTANAGSDVSQAAGTVFTIDATGSAPGTGGNTLSYATPVQTGGASVTPALQSPGVWTYTGSSPTTQITRTFRVDVTEVETGQTASDSVSHIEQAVVPAVGPSDTVASASPVTATVGDTVTFSYTTTAGDTAIASQSWTEPSGVTLSSTTAAAPTWDTTGAAEGAYTLWVTVTDGNSLTDSDSVTVTVIEAGDRVGEDLDLELLQTSRDGVATRKLLVQVRGVGDTDLPDGTTLKADQFGIVKGGPWRAGGDVNVDVTPPPPALLLESGDGLLLESGDALLLEAANG